jgi:hypothetical protein
VDRFFQALLLLSTAGFSWLMTMVLHELGHVLHGWLSGAELVAVVLPPWSFSRTDFAANPHPQFVAWGGGLWGCLMPLAILAIFRIAAPRYSYLARWFAGFCLVVNGAYLAGGGFHSGGADDASVILQSGGSRWILLAFGIPAVAAGLYLWHGLGPHFGLGLANGRVDRRAAVGTAVALLVVACAEVAAGLANVTLV